MEGYLLAMFIRDVPGELREVMVRLQIIFPEMFQEVDTRTPGYKFPCFHFDWYNRYAEKVSSFSPFIQIILIQTCVEGGGFRWQSGRVSSLPRPLCSDQPAYFDSTRIHGDFRVSRGVYYDDGRSARAL